MSEYDDVFRALRLIGLLGMAFAIALAFGLGAWIF